MVSKLFSSLILFVVLCNLLLVSCEETKPTVNGAAATTPTTLTPVVTEKQKVTTPTAIPSGAKETSPAPKDKDDDKDPDVMTKVSADCKVSVAHCFSAASTVAELKNKKLADVTCDAIGKGKDCFTTGTGGKKCSEDDFDKVKQYVCFCPRTAASVVLVAVLCVLSTFFGRQ